MRFLTRPELDAAIRRVVEGKKVRCAVAFWGKGAEALFANPNSGPERARIICNLRSGGTNPEVIRRLIGSGVQLRQRDDLHAKVYISDRGAVVASANASANGMSLEGSEQDGWLEAGVEFQSSPDVAAWFETVWEGSKKITDSDLKAAQETWTARQRSKPQLLSFANFDADAAVLPLVDWWENSDWENDSESVERQLGRYDADVEKLIDDGLHVQPGEEEGCFQHGRWVLYWQRVSGRPSKREPFEWFCIDRVIMRAFRYKEAGKLGELQDVAIRIEKQPPEPFDLKDTLFRRAFSEVIMRDAFSPLREDLDKRKPWHTPRQKVTREFWRSTKAHYESLRISKTRSRHLGSRGQMR